MSGSFLLYAVNTPAVALKSHADIYGAYDFGHYAHFHVHISSKIKHKSIYLVNYLGLYWMFWHNILYRLPVPRGWVSLLIWWWMSFSTYLTFLVRCEIISHYTAESTDMILYRCSITSIRSIFLGQICSCRTNDIFRN